LVKAILGGITRAKADTGGIMGRKEKWGKGVAKMKTFGISKAKLDKQVESDIRG
jgi:hypothetical protein